MSLGKPAPPGDPPACSCHGEPCRWQRDPSLNAGGRWLCRVRAREYNRRWYEAHRDRVQETHRESSRRWREANREQVRESRRHREQNREYAVTRRHGISRAQRNAMYEAQGQACAGCRTPMLDSELEIDHDHACCPGPRSCGGCVRGLVCRSCNARDALAPSPSISAQTAS